jgi:hypothetical protein
MDISRPDDGIWQTYVSQEDVANPFCINEPGTEEVIGQSVLSATFPERIQNVLCTFLSEGFEGQGAPVGGSGSMGVSFWNDIGSQIVQVRTKWAGTPPAACDPGNTCAFESGVFSQDDGQAADTPVNCLIDDLEDCAFDECSAGNCFNGVLSTNVSPLVKAACLDFQCPVNLIKNPSFEEDVD